MTRPDIKAVFLDAGKTLFEETVSRPESFRQVASDHGAEPIDLAHVATVLDRALQELPTTWEGNFRYSLAWFQAYNGRVLSELGVAEDGLEKACEAIAKIYRDPANYRLFEEVPECLAELGRLDIRIGVVSNWSEVLPELMAELGLCEHVSFIVTSADLKAEKPDRPIFERALFRAGVPAAEAVHVGNHFENDVRGALNAGMRAVWIDRTTEGISDREGVPVVQDLRCFLGLLQAAVPSRN